MSMRFSMVSSVTSRALPSLIESLHARVLLAVGADDSRDQRVGGGGTGEGNDQRAFDTLGSASRLEGTLLDAGEDHSRFIEKHQPAGSQVDALGVALEQVESQLLFEGTYLLAEGRLLHVQASGSAGEMSLFGHHDEIT